MVLRLAFGDSVVQPAKYVAVIPSIAAANSFMSLSIMFPNQISFQPPPASPLPLLPMKKAAGETCAGFPSRAIL